MEQEDEYHEVDKYDGTELIFDVELSKDQADKRFEVLSGL